MSYVFLLARRILFKRKGSVMLAAGAVAATIFLNIFSTTVFNGVETGVLSDISDLRFGDLFVSYNRGEITTPQSQLVITALSNPEVEGIAPRLITNSNINFSDITGVTPKYNVETIGVDPTLEPGASKLNSTLVSGRLDLLYQNAIILGANLASDLGASQGQVVVMKTIAVDGAAHIKRFQVVGISHHPGFSGFDDSAIVNIKTLRDMTGVQENRNPTYIIRLKNPNDAGNVKAWMQSRFPKLTVQSVAEAASGFKSSIDQVVGFINLIGYAGMIASAMGVITILTMMVAGKTRDVGVLRALGVQQWEILEVFVLDGAIIGGIGATAGGIAGTLTTLYLEVSQPPLLGSFPLVVTFTPAVLVSPIVIGVLITLLASLYPAWRASRYRPAEAMRYF